MLTVLLTDRLIAASQGRVVTTSSLAHTFVDMDFQNLSPAEKDYNRFFAYSHSKSANVLFSAELARRLNGLYLFNLSSPNDALKHHSISL